MLSRRLLLTGMSGLALSCSAERPAAGPPRIEASPSPLAASPSASPSPQRYVFSQDWFSAHIPLWSRVLAPYRGRPGVEYLEVGVFEGRSALWMLDEILTDPSARLTGVDLFGMTGLKDRYLSNLEKSGRSAQAVTIAGYSQIELRKLPLEKYDIIYIDGSHRADDVMADAILCWWLLKEGGLIIFDDYAHRGAMTWSEPAWPAELTPRLAIDAFLTAFSDSLELVHRQYQVIVRKRPKACGTASCSVIGHYLYSWDSHELTRATGEVVSLTAEERSLIESIARSKTYGEVKVKVPSDLSSDPRYIELKRKLQLEL